MVTETAKNRRFWPPHCRLRPLSKEPPRISTWTLYCLKVESVGYIFLLLAVCVYRLSNFVMSSERPVICAVECGRSRSSKVVEFGRNRKCLWDFLLVINSNLDPISDRFWDTTTDWLSLWVVKVADSEDFVMIACVVLIQSQSVTDTQTDRTHLWHS